MFTKLFYTFFIVTACFTNAYSQGKTSKPAPSTNPGSCRIEGKIIKIFSPDTSAGAGMCAKYPCRAQVKILAVYDCGSSVSARPNVGDVVEMNFAYTLHNTSKIYPHLKAKYPGLKKGDIFYANAEQRLKVGNGIAFTVFAYQHK